MNNVEFFIVGQGLAGTLLAFEMLQSNMETLNITQKNIPGNYQDIFFKTKRILKIPFSPPIVKLLNL